MRPLRAFLALWPLFVVLLGEAPLFADASRLFVRNIPDEKTFDVYSRALGADRLGKFLIDLRSGEVYYFDVNIYRLHADFVFNVIYRRQMRGEDIPEYNKNYEADKPRFVLGTLTHHLKTDQWTFGFWEGDRIRATEIRKVRDRLRASFFQEELKFRPDSPLQEKLLAELSDLPSITNDKLYKASTYQSFNNGTATGILRVVPPGTLLDSQVFRREEIVLLQESYPDIPPVSGILATAFSTPLSHVNLRAKEWDIPNAGFKRAVADYAALDGKIVFFQVSDVDHVLRLATDAESKLWQQARGKAKAILVPLADLRSRQLLPLGRIHRSDARIYGSKAANLGEIASARLPGLFVPDGFGVPFAFYVDHMRRHRLDKKLDVLLKDTRFAGDPTFRKAELEGLRAAIRAAPLNPRVLSTIYAQVKRDLKGQGVFVRSSTNAEDLAGFNGAGLYTTVPNVKGKKELGIALKTVWASLWNFHAVEERGFFGIDHRSVYAGVLVQVGVNAQAAGVLVTKNLYDAEDTRSYTINAKRGLGLRVVAGTTVPEQIVYDTGNEGTKIISRSDDPTMLVFDEKGGIKEIPNDNRDVILSEARAKALCTAVESLVPLFPLTHPLDVEWVLEGERMWIVQARPYVAKN